MEVNMFDTDTDADNFIEMHVLKLEFLKRMGKHGNKTLFDAQETTKFAEKVREGKEYISNHQWAPEH